MNLLVLNWQDRQNPQAGGAEAHLHEVFGRLVRRGHGVTLLCSGWPGAASHAVLDGIEVHRTGGRHTFPLAALRACRRLRAESFDLVIEDLNKVPLFTPLWVGRPVVLLVHHLFGLTAFQEASPPVAALTWLLERPIARVYRGVPVQVVSRSTADDLEARGFEPARIEVITNGVDLAGLGPGPDTDRSPLPTVLYLGRLKRYKRVDLVMRAVARLTAEGFAVRLVVAGEGDQADALKRLRDRLGLRGVVEMTGYVDDAHKLRLLRSAWVHVLTSPKEGWGITNLEAAACATPSVCSDSPGLRDSVVDGETGLLVPHGDVPALAAALRRLLEDADLRAELGQGALRFARNFTWERSAERTEEHLAGILQGRKPGAGPVPRECGEALVRAPEPRTSARRKGWRSR